MVYAGGSWPPTWSCLCRKGLFGVGLAEVNGLGIFRLCLCARLFPEARERGSGQATAAVLVWKGGSRRSRGGLWAIPLARFLHSLPSLLFNPLWPLFQSLLAGMATKVCFAPTALPVSGVALHVKGITLIYFCKRTLASIFQVEKQTHEGLWNFTRGMTVGRKGKRVDLLLI